MLSQKYKLHLILGLNHVLLTYCKFCFLHLSCESLFEEGNLLSPDHKLSIYSAEWMISLLLNLANFFFSFRTRKWACKCCVLIECSVSHVSLSPMRKVNANPPKLFFLMVLFTVTSNDICWAVVFFVMGVSFLQEVKWVCDLFLACSENFSTLGKKR